MKESRGEGEKGSGGDYTPEQPAAPLFPFPPSRLLPFSLSPFLLY